MIIFMGVAGSGKSVQGKLLADHLGLPWLSTGEFLRMLIAGEKRKGMMQGQLLEDAEIITLVQKILSIIDAKQQFVLDGFPRTPAQVDWLLSQVKHGQLRITAVIHLTASAEAVKARLLQRARPDDHDEAIRERFREYEESAKPILDRFRTEATPVFDIDGEGPIDEVQDRIRSALNPLLK